MCPVVLKSSLCDVSVQLVEICYLKLQLSGAMRIFAERILNSNLRKKISFKNKLNAASIGLGVRGYVVAYFFHV